MALLLIGRTGTRMECLASIPTLTTGAFHPNRLHTDNADEFATIRAGIGSKSKIGAGTIRIIRRINPQSRAAAHPEVAVLQQE